VAVKVQYPDITNLVATDLTVLEQIVKAINRLAPTIQLQPIVDYLQETLPLELDFAHEAEAMTSLRAALAHRDDVLVPTVIPGLRGCVQRPQVWVCAKRLSMRRIIAMKIQASSLLGSTS
jgi:predicted unusual protein kinase regulating ubiquinone biosynthesis (AarF/ABC1/UbiB family)